MKFNQNTLLGLFLNGINTLAPLWIIVDIYGNSIVGKIVMKTIEPLKCHLRELSSSIRPTFK